MTVIHLAPAVAEAFADTLIAVVTAIGLRATQSWPATVTAMTDLE